MNKPDYHVVSFSGGKDSTAMLLRMIELGYHIDEVVFCDTTMEFPGMIRHVEKVKKVVEDAGIKFVTLRSQHNFEFFLTEVDVPNRRKDSNHYGVPGYGWPSHKIRWCTKHLKLELIKKHFKELTAEHNLIQYIGRLGGFVFFQSQKITHRYTEETGDLLGSFSADSLFSAHFQVSHKTAAQSQFVTKTAGADAVFLTQRLDTHK